MPNHPNLRADRTEGTGAMNTSSAPSIYVARSLPAAIDALKESGADGAPFAGGTWIMRSPIRHEPHKPHYVAIGMIAELTAIRIDADVVEIGAAVTHAALAAALADLPEFNVLATAAGRSANPAVRTMATVGGNLATSGFAAADCVPALLCLDAEVEISSRGDRERIGLERFLKIRSTLEPGRLLTRIILPRSGRKTAHARLPLRKSGDYPAAIVSLAVSFDAAARIQAARIAVGSVEGGLPPSVRNVALVGIGALIGARFARMKIRTLLSHVNAALGSFAVAIVISAVFVTVIALTTHVRFADIVVAFAPGAMDAMLALALTLYIDPIFVGAHHLSRFVFVTIATPGIVHLFGRPQEDVDD